MALSQTDLGLHTLIVRDPPRCDHQGTVSQLVGIDIFVRFQLSVQELLGLTLPPAEVDSFGNQVTSSRNHSRPCPPGSCPLLLRTLSTFNHESSFSSVRRCDMVYLKESLSGIVLARITLRHRYASHEARV
jgi:hypothetical protein